jgi:type I restriction enzyme S subunit
MERYDSYKDSGVEWIGEIPRHWEFERTKTLCGRDKNPIQVVDFAGLDVVHYSIPNVQECGKGIIENGDDIDSSKLLLTGGEILVSKLNPRKGCVTKVEPSNDLLIIGSGEFIPLIPKSNLNVDFLLFFVKSSRYSEYLDSNVESVTRSHQRVSPDIVYDLRIPLPPLHEQERIVEYLDRKTALIDSLIEKTVRKIELLREKRTALINHVVTKGLNPDVEMKDSGVEWIGEIPRHWGVSKIKFECEIFGRIGFRGYTTEDIVDEGEGVVSISPSNIVNNEFNLKNRTYLSWDKYHESPEIQIFPGDVILVKTGSVGKTAIIPEGVSEMTLNPQLVVLKNIKPHNKYLFAQTTCRFIKESFDVEQTGSTTPTISQEKIKEFPLLLPPFHEQEQIVEYLDNQTSIIDSTIATEEKRIELLKEYRQSLISEVVTGKVKVTRDE